ncbi:dual specificity phosphatase 28-like isoform X1 [Scylla paramamosain]|uniref:dual specificity phosphatase 28-like isoform X1 n=1 Tax=Scylla paramamosain TaxID=85552 RepID=UPI003082B479
MGLSKVWQGLWVGPARAISSTLLSQHNITTLVWATPEVHLPPLHEGVNVVQVLVQDSPSQELGPHLRIVSQAFMECQARGEGMAVVCRAGKSRSAALALAVLVALPEAHLTLREAYFTIKAARPLIRPNPGFFAQGLMFYLANPQKELSKYYLYCQDIVKAETMPRQRPGQYQTHQLLKNTKKPKAGYMNLQCCCQTQSLYVLWLIIRTCQGIKTKV